MFLSFAGAVYVISNICAVSNVQYTLLVFEFLRIYLFLASYFSKQFFFETLLSHIVRNTVVTGSQDSNNSQTIICCNSNAFVIVNPLNVSVALIRNQSIYLLCKSIDWFLYEGNTDI